MLVPREQKFWSDFHQIRLTGLLHREWKKLLDNLNENGADLANDALLRQSILMKFILCLF